jgi:holliday junction DNA helicase RuvA
MIRLIEGIVATTSPTSVVVLVHGVGYLIHTNATKYAYTAGDSVTFHTYLAVRETALDLYGFRTTKELEFFELLLSVPKIGPKSALQILNQADPDLIATAVIINDADHLHTVSGIGKKTASNIVTALSGKIDATTTTIDTALPVSSDFSPNQQDAIDALVTLGYDHKEAQVLILKLDNNLPAKDLIQAVLKRTT